MMAACTSDPGEAAFESIEQRMSDKQLERLVQEAEYVLSQYPAEPDPSRDLKLAPTDVFEGVHVSYWRDGNRIGRGFSANSNVVLAARDAAWVALRNVKDPRRLQPHVVVMDNPRPTSLTLLNVGMDALAVRSSDGALIGTSVMPPAMAIEQGRSKKSVISRLKRWVDNESEIVALDAIHVTRDGSGGLTRLSYAAERHRSSNVELAKIRMVEWLRENQQRKPWGYPVSLQPWSGDDSIRPDLTWQLKLALAASELRRDTAVTYFQHETDVVGIKQRASASLHKGVACLSCGGEDALLDTAIALLVFARSEQVDSESLVGQAMAKFVTQNMTPDIGSSEKDLVTLAYAYVALRDWRGLTEVGGDLGEDLIAAREALHSELAQRASRTHVQETPFWAEVLWLSQDDQLLNSVSYAALKNLRSSVDLSVVESPTAILAGLAAREGDHYFDEVLLRQFLFSDTYLCPQRYQCLGGVKGDVANGVVSARAWWSMFLMLTSARSEVSKLSRR